MRIWEKDGLHAFRYAPDNRDPTFSKDRFAASRIRPFAMAPELKCTDIWVELGHRVSSIEQSVFLRI